LEIFVAIFEIQNNEMGANSLIKEKPYEEEDHRIALEETLAMSSGFRLDRNANAEGLMEEK